jgi:hypothetical protein
LSGAIKPARATDDFPLPDAPTMGKAIDRLAFRSRTHFVQKPLNQSFTPEEKGGISFLRHSRTTDQAIGFCRTKNGELVGSHCLLRRRAWMYC